MCGIYMISNLRTGKNYIGQSKDIYTRWYKHKNFLNGNSHHNKHLQASWNKYGEDSFSFNIIEECPEEELNERESYYIKKYNTKENGYNLDDGGNGIRGYKHTEEELEKMKMSHNSLVVLQFDKNFILVNRWKGGIGEAYKSMRKYHSCTYACIRMRCYHTIKEMSSYLGYYWIFEQEYNSIGFSWADYLNNRKFIIDTSGVIGNSSRKIIQYDLYLNKIAEWNSLSEIRKAGYNSHQVCSICNHSRGKKTHEGFIWTFEGYDFSDGYFDNTVRKSALHSIA